MKDELVLPAAIIAAALSANQSARETLAQVQEHFVQAYRALEAAQAQVKREDKVAAGRS